MTSVNTYATRAQRSEAHDSLDFFPTPPWATRALIEHVLVGGGWRKDQLAEHVCWEPACGADHMVNPLAEYFAEVIGTDVHDHGPALLHDFLMPFLPPIVKARPGPHWIITNPPFRLGQQFILRALEIASEGVCMLVRTQFLEGIQRHQELFLPHPPLMVAPFVERVPMVKGRLDRGASTATAYAWLVWAGRRASPKRFSTDTKLRWIPACRRALERDEDYT
ncbi:MAG: methyltransferase [Pseudomonadota bacterium]|nr:methyltransferase [Pseudomonadota bacterium]